tara:strand:+ start:1509 stop:1730 length:222 start_codon:yes stop_codon:yes gene_type:complete
MFSALASLQTTPSLPATKVLYTPTEGVGNVVKFSGNFSEPLVHLEFNSNIDLGIVDLSDTRQNAVCGPLIGAI